MMQLSKRSRGGIPFRRSLKGLIENVQLLDSLGIRFYVPSQGIDADNRSPMGRLFLDILGAFAELDRGFGEGCRQCRCPQAAATIPYTPEGWLDALVDDQARTVERYDYDLDGNVTVLDAGGASPHAERLLLRTGANLEAIGATAPDLQPLRPAAECRFDLGFVARNARAQLQAR